MEKCEYLIIGAGITGLTIARELINKGERNICIIDKEEQLGVHASGRNSGVLHSGIYYEPGSLKAKFCAEGNKLLSEYCDKNGLSIKRWGKVIVASDEKQLVELFKLQERAEKNGVNSRIIFTDELRDIEPYARTFKNAIFSPETSAFDPKEVLNCLYNELLDSGCVEILLGTEFISQQNGSAVKTSEGNIKFKKLINCSGAFSDKVAHGFGVAMEYKILPFIGTYCRLADECSRYVKGNIYPVPDPRSPFLGIHFSRSTDGKVYLGPTAIPAIGRESYNITSGISFESLSIIYRDMIMFFRNAAFRDNAISEIKKCISSYVFKEAKKMIPDLKREDVLQSSKAGIRAQLVNWDKKRMVMDFFILRKDNTVHILNAVSPAFTSSMSFAKYVVNDFMVGNQ